MRNPVLRLTLALLAFVASAKALATAGTVKASIAGRADAAGNAYAQAVANFSDTFTMSKSGMEGKAGTLTVAFFYDYEIQTEGWDGGNAGMGSMAFSAQLGNSYGRAIRNIQNAGASYYADNLQIEDLYGTRHTPGVLANLIFVRTDFQWGSNITTTLDLHLLGQASGPGGYASFSVDAYHSGYWAGIVSATADGQEVFDYSVTAASGIDYSRSFVPTAVPEPASAMLLMLGLAVLASLKLAQRQVRHGADAVVRFG